AWMAGLASAVAGLLAMAAWQSRHAAMQKLATQAALQAAHDTLETRVAERTQQLSSANTALALEVDHRKAVEQSLRDTQQELVHAAKMAVLGQISAGLAHELNQPLAALRTLSDNAAVLMDKQRLPETRANLQRISHLVGRLGELTRRLKTFAHKPGDQPVATPLAAAVANAQGLLAERLRRLGVQVQVEIAPDTPDVLADPGLIEQVLVNLMVNALDAMAGAPQRRLRIHADADAGLVRLAVSDSGPGITPQMLPRLFEPFATSKPPGAGLGLGLMISRRIVREFGGELSATQNGSEGGATFVMTLPVAPAAAPAPIPAPVSTSSSPAP
ncbi:MAG: sensor histidine kinase, partial [Rubrivivax sp.]|nr:sensor histidine kinase [Rubrivivax sp.]